MAAVEEDVTAEFEAVQAVYGNDCVVLNSYPPRLHLHIKPRTADVASQQFVEAVIAIRASPQYLEEPPCIYVVDSKGLDEERQKHLTTYIKDKECVWGGFFAPLIISAALLPNTLAASGKQLPEARDFLSQKRKEPHLSFWKRDAASAL